MRSAGNFSPEWGYLAPAPSFLRTARVVVVATAIGATAGAGVVLSLIDRPVAEADKTPFAARAIVTSVQAAPVATVTPAPIAAVSVPSATGSRAAAPSIATPKTAIPAAVAPGSLTAVPAPVAPTQVAPAPVASRQQAEAPVTQPAAMANVPADNVTASVPSSPSRPASDVAALSDTAAATDKATLDNPNLTIAAPEPATTTPPKKKASAPSKPQGLGTVLQRLFSSNANRQSVH
jgi:hypothetical protein